MSAFAKNGLHFITIFKVIVRNWPPDINGARKDEKKRMNEWENKWTDVPWKREQYTPEHTEGRAYEWINERTDKSSKL